MTLLKKILLVGLLSTSSIAFAQENKYMANKIFNHLDIALTAGSSGLGIEFASPIGNMVQLRTGFSFMPEFRPKMNFGVQVGDDPEESKSKFEQMSSALSKLVGYEVDNTIDMIGDPNIYNWSVLVDVRPFKNNKHWHFTAGFYLGPSTIAYSYNTTEDMPSLLAVGIYNRFYDYFAEEKYWDAPIYDDVFLDPSIGDGIKSMLEGYGRMGMNMGTYKRDIYNENGELVHKKGDKYIMTPGENSMVKAQMKVNMFKPYVGFGYGGRLIKNNDRAHISFDCGIMMWGGSPSLITHDGTDLIHDVENVPGKVGDYVDVFEHLKVYPVLNLRLSYRLF